jgi:hypothetical protein
MIEYLSVYALDVGAIELGRYESICSSMATSRSWSRGHVTGMPSILCLAPLPMFIVVNFGCIHILIYVVLMRGQPPISWHRTDNGDWIATSRVCSACLTSVGTRRFIPALAVCSH